MQFRDERRGYLDITLLQVEDDCGFPEAHGHCLVALAAMSLCSGEAQAQSSSNKPTFGLVNEGRVQQWCPRAAEIGGKADDLLLGTLPRRIAVLSQL